MNKQEEIKNEIFDAQGKAEVKIDDQDIKADNIFVIKSIENSYFQHFQNQPQTY